MKGIFNMNRDTMIEKLLQKYSKNGVTVEEITYMVEAGFDNDLEPEIILENADMQLSEEYKGE